MSPREPAALRSSLDARLTLLARERGQDVNRLRRHLTFQRLLRRLDETWVLKGGYLLEARLGTRARATKDVDLAVLERVEDLGAALTDALETDIDGDGFVFLVRSIRGHLADTGQLGGPGARMSVTALLAGRSFADIRVDVVARPQEIAGGTERVTLPVIVAEPQWAPVTVLAVDLAQHLAEKLHALSAVDAHPRPSTRVKDLLDVVLVSASTAVDLGRLGDRIRAVFGARDGAPPPGTLPDPPAAWVSDYAAMAGELGVLPVSLDAAMAVARSLYARALGTGTSKEQQ